VSVSQESPQGVKHIKQGNRRMCELENRSRPDGLPDTVSILVAAGKTRGRQGFRLIGQQCWRGAGETGRESGNPTSQKNTWWKA